jgi:hypothetical protein
MILDHADGPGSPDHRKFRLALRAIRFIQIAAVPTY